MSVHEHVDIKIQIIRFQSLYIRFLKLKLQQPILDNEEHHQASMRTVLDAMDRGTEHAIGPSDRQISSSLTGALADGLSLNEDSCITAGTLSIDLLVSNNWPRP